MLISDTVADYLRYAKHEAGLTQSSLTSYGSGLRHFLRWLESEGHHSPNLLEHFTTQILRQYLYAQSEKGKRPRSIRGDFSPLKALAVFLVDRGDLAANPVIGITLPKKDAPDRPVTSDAECVAILAACDRLRTPRRAAMARALLGVIIWCGLRANEALSVKVSDVSLERQTLTVVRGKGKKSRVLYPPSEALDALKKWLEERDHKPIETDYLFAYDPKRRIAYNGLLGLLREVKLIAGFGDRDHIMPHSLRRSFATRLMNKGATIRTIQSALGHSEAQTTFGYLAMASEPARAMADLGSLSEVSSSPKVVPTPPFDPQPAPKPTRADLLQRQRRRVVAK